VRKASHPRALHLERQRTAIETCNHRIKKKKKKEMLRTLPVDPAGRRLPDPPDPASRERREPRRISLHRRAPLSGRPLSVRLDSVHEARFPEAPVVIIPYVLARPCGRDAAPPGCLARHPSSVHLLAAAEASCSNRAD